jgi:acid phosphatase
MLWYSVIILKLRRVLDRVKGVSSLFDFTNTRQTMPSIRLMKLAALTAAMSLGPGPAGAADDADLAKIETVVVIYSENRSFDNLYGHFPGANGVQNLPAEVTQQVDRDGTPLKELPPIWGGLTAKGVDPAVTQAQTEHLPNAPFAIDDPKRFNLPLEVATIDLVHRFYQNQMQIDGGKNDRFVAYSDASALVMGHYDGSKLPLWDVAKRYALADNFFMGAFGGSFLNHFHLICACTPYYPQADQSSAKSEISAVEPDGVSLKLAADSPKSAMDG